MTISFQKKTNTTVEKNNKPEKKESSSTTTTTTNSINNQDNNLNGIGSYEYIKPLGNGKFSRVMLAYHLETHQQVAIKVG